MRIRVLVDNRECKGWHAEHGLCLLLEHSSGMLMFDTGAGEALAFNLKKVGISPREIRSVVLSHGHYDHTGGLSIILEQSNAIEVYCGEDVAKCRFSLHTGMPVKELSMPPKALESLQNHSQNRIHVIRKPTVLNDEIVLTGVIERKSFEDCGGPFFLDTEGRLPDLIEDEIALLTRSGVLIQGCCHAGIMNTVEHCRRQYPEIAIRTIIGGLHLVHAGQERLEQTAKYLNTLGLETLILLHCTGSEGADYLKKHLLCEVVIGCTGDLYDK